MPINEARGLARSRLTPQEKKEQEAAIYGLRSATPMDSNIQLTSEEIERMRLIVAQHDKGAKAKEFDLNKPPKERYVHQEFPRVVYHHETGTTRVAQTEAELAKHLSAGYSKEPVAAQADPDPDAGLDAADAAEAAAVDARRVKKPRK